MYDSYFFFFVSPWRYQAASVELNCEEDKRSYPNSLLYTLDPFTCPSRPFLSPYWLVASVHHQEGVV